MKTRFKLSFARLGLVFILGLGAARVRAEMLYGLTFFDNQLISLDTSTGAGTLIGSIGETVSGYGLASSGGMLYTFDPNLDALRTVNKTTGGIGAAMSIGVGDLTGEGDLAFRADGMGFLSSALAPDFSPSNELFMFDAQLGTAALVGNTAVPIDGMVFVGNTLYAIGQEADAKLYTVDQTNAAMTEVGSLGIPKNSPFGALTLGINGQLYAAIDDRLYGINQATGAASILNEDVLDIGYGSVSGLAPTSFQPVPEPSTYAIGGAALLFLAGIVRRVKQSRAAT